MTMTQIMYFVAVAEESSMTRVAARFQVSQPAVSLAIRDLEKEYHVVLFERRRNELYLTQTGKAVYHLAKSLLMHYNNFCQTLSETEPKQAFSIAVAPNVAAIHLADLFQYIKVRVPNAVISMQEDYIVNMKYMLKNNIIDAACFACSEDYMDESLQFVPVSSFSFVLCASPELLDLPRQAITPSDLRGIPIVSQFKASLVNDLIYEYFAQEDIVPNILFQAYQITTMLSFVRKGLAAAFLPRELVADDESIIIYDLEDFPSENDFIIYFVYKNRTEAIETLRSAVCGYFKTVS